MYRADALRLHVLLPAKQKHLFMVYVRVLVPGEIHETPLYVDADNSMAEHTKRLFLFFRAWCMRKSSEVRIESPRLGIHSKGPERDMCCVTRVLLPSVATAVLCFQQAASFTLRPSTTATRNHDILVHREHHAADVFFNNNNRRRGPTATVRGTVALTELRISEEDRERDLKFERDLDRDAQLWVNGDPGKQKLWDKAKSWRNLNKSEHFKTAVHVCLPLLLLLCCAESPTAAVIKRSTSTTGNATLCPTAMVSCWFV